MSRKYDGQISRLQSTSHDMDKCRFPKNSTSVLVLSITPRQQTQSTFTCSLSTVETSEQCVKFVQVNNKDTRTMLLTTLWCLYIVESLISDHHWEIDACPLIRNARLLKSQKSYRLVTGKKEFVHQLDESAF